MVNWTYILICLYTHSFSVCIFRFWSPSGPACATRHRPWDVVSSSMGDVGDPELHSTYHRKGRSSMCSLYFFIMIGLPWLPHIVWFLVYIMIQLYIYFGCLVDLFRSWYFHGLYPIGKLKGLPYWYCRDCRSKNIIAKIRRTKMWLLLLQIIYIYIAGLW